MVSCGIHHSNQIYLNQTLITIEEVGCVLGYSPSFCLQGITTNQTPSANPNLLRLGDELFLSQLGRIHN
jgi:hypothetical protein